MVSSVGSLVKLKCFMKVSHSIPSNSIDHNLVDRGNDRACVCGGSDAHRDGKVQFGLVLQGILENSKPVMSLPVLCLGIPTFFQHFPTFLGLR
jgi:hypothetical protein